MKITALIEDSLIEEVKKVSGGKNITESLTIALKDYLRSKKIDYVIREVERQPFVFNEDFEPYGTRDKDRKR